MFRPAIRAPRRYAGRIRFPQRQRRYFYNPRPMSFGQELYPSKVGEPTTLLEWDDDVTGDPYDEFGGTTTVNGGEGYPAAPSLGPEDTVPTYVEWGIADVGEATFRWYFHTSPEGPPAGPSSIIRLLDGLGLAHVAYLTLNDEMKVDLRRDDGTSLWTSTAVLDIDTTYRFKVRIDNSPSPLARVEIYNIATDLPFEDSDWVNDTDFGDPVGYVRLGTATGDEIMPAGHFYDSVKVVATISDSWDSRHPDDVAAPQEIVVPPASLMLSGVVPTLTTGTVSITVPPASLTLSGVAPTLTGSGVASITGVAGSLTLAGVVPTLLGSGAVSITVPPAEITLTGVNPTLTAGAVSITVPPASLTLASIGATLTGAGAASITVTSGSLTLAGVAATVTAGSVEITVPPAQMALASVEIEIDANVEVTVPPAAITLSGVAPILTGSGDVSLVAPPAGLTLTSVAPTVATGTAEIAAESSVITLTGVAVAITAIGVATIEIPPANMTLSGGQVVVLTAGQTEAPPAELRLEAVPVAVAGSGVATITAPPAEIVIVGVAPVISSGATSIVVPPASLTLSGAAVQVSGTGSAEAIVTSGQTVLAAMPVSFVFGTIVVGGSGILVISNPHGAELDFDDLTAQLTVTPVGGGLTLEDITSILDVSVVGGELVASQ